LFGNVSYRAIVKQEFCEADTVTKDFFIFNLINSFENFDTITFGDSIQLISTIGITFEWSPSMYLSDNLVANPVAYPPNSINYDVIVIDSNGCQTNSTHNIFVKENLNPISSNNFISPNGDGINDTWVIQNISLFPQNSVFVFNNYGQMVFSESPYKNDWDVNSASLPDGPYFYSITAEPNTTPYKGTITIISNK
jgi:gliding motility-associated-like protein